MSAHRSGGAYRSGSGARTHAWSVQALLTDLDGVLVDSIVAIERAWSQWADRHGLDHAEVFTGLHGVRAIEHVRRLLPDRDTSHEVACLERAELTFVSESRKVPGAAELVAALPRHRWAVVTSGSRVLATARLRAVGLPVPGVLIAAEDVVDGKPDPEGYRKAARALGCDPNRCLVIEDAPAGVRAARAAGCATIAVATSHLAAELTLADVVVSDPRDVAVTTAAAHLKVVAAAHAGRTD